MGDIKDGDDEKITFTFKTPRDLDDEDTFDVDITVTGEDENDAEHTASLSFEVVIKRDKHEIVVESVDVRPASLRCEESIQVTVEMRNIGQEDEDEVAIKLQFDEINYEKGFRNLELDTDDRTTRSFTIPLNNPLPAGDYFLDIITYYDTTKETDSFIEKFTAFGCSDDQEPDDEPEPDDDVDVPDVIFPPTGNVVTGEVAGKGFTNSTWYVVLLVLVGILILLIIIVLIVKFLI